MWGHKRVNQSVWGHKGGHCGDNKGDVSTVWGDISIVWGPKRGIITVWSTKDGTITVWGLRKWYYYWMEYQEGYIYTWCTLDGEFMQRVGKMLEK